GAARARPAALGGSRHQNIGGGQGVANMGNRRRLARLGTIVAGISVTALAWTGVRRVMARGDAPIEMRLWGYKATSLERTVSCFQGEPLQLAIDLRYPAAEGDAASARAARLPEDQAQIRRLRIAPPGRAWTDFVEIEVRRS